MQSAPCEAFNVEIQAPQSGPEPRALLALALAARSLLHLGLVLAACAGAFRLGGGLLACCALQLLALQLIGRALGICHECASAFVVGCVRRELQSLKLGELLHQLLHAVPFKLYCNLRVISFAFAAKHGARAVFGVAHA